MILRVLALLAVLGVAVGTQPQVSQAAHAPSDTSILRTASVRLGRGSSGAVLHWLRAQRPVRSAGLGRDGITLDIRFRDGREMLVLPKRIGTTRVSAASNSLRPLARVAQSAGARALVLEPFASELGLGSNPGAPVASALQASGFTVDQGLDTQVTVATMATMPAYAVVYMHTHAGVTQAGTGVVATGQPANGDPSVQPYLADGSVMVIGVAGSNAQYYGITSQFISQHESSFRADSLIFINGCALLQTSDFWTALANKGAGVLVSWTADSTNKDNYLAGVAFFNVMQQDGSSVSGAIDTLRQNGYGTSSYNGQTATLGFSGNGGITLAAAAVSGPSVQPTPTPRATATPTTATTEPVPTPTHTATPQPTSAPTPTATARAVPLSISGIKTSVPAGSKQSFQVHGPATAPVAVRVTYPNGDVHEQTAQLGADGSTQIQFKQPGSRITRKSHTATVLVTGATGTPSARATYKIGFGKVDLSVEPRFAHRGTSVVIWVHARPRVPVEVEVLPVKNRHDRFTVRTGTKGWAKTRYIVRRARRAGTSLMVKAQLLSGRKHPHTFSSLSVR